MHRSLHGEAGRRQEPELQERFGEEIPEGCGQGGRGDHDKLDGDSGDHVTGLEPLEIAIEFDEASNLQAQHFFVDLETHDPSLSEEIVDFESKGEEQDSITRFLTLPTITERSKPRNRDPILDYTTSKILTETQYEEAAQQLKDSRENVAREKERKATEERRVEESKRRKLAERAAAIAAKAAAREEAARMKELRVAEQAEAQAGRQAEKDQGGETEGSAGC